MNKNNNFGKFIVFEGLDSSGKSIQTDLLVRSLREKGKKVETIDFPQYGKKSAGLIEEYLSGKYGKADQVNPKVASIFYACDRFDGAFLIKKWLREGKYVVSDRYVASNAAHQGGKMKSDKKREEYLDWLYNIEYKTFGIPKPDKTIFLKTNPQFALENLKKKKKTDIHEKDKNHLIGAYKTYLYLAEAEDHFETVEVLREGKFLKPEEISRMILKLIKE